MGDRYVGPKGRVLTYISLAEMPDIPYWIPSNLSHQQPTKPTMSFTSSSSNQVFITPAKEKISRTNSCTHVANALSMVGYPTNLEVGWTRDW